MKKLIGLADCNNFFVSCERTIRPELNGKPVVVLSNNDGCVVSRSNEAKALGVPMGAPLFKWEAFFKTHGVTIISGNHELYSQISHRVMKALGDYSDVVDQYSVDEAFFNLAIASISDHFKYCDELCSHVLKESGVPVSIGISTTKTLCKLGSEVAKARCRSEPNAKPVCMMLAPDAMPFFKKLPPEKVWGIGRRTAKVLHNLGITTVADLLSMDEKTIRAKTSIRVVQTMHELRGKPEFPLSQTQEKQKSMMVSSSFGSRLTELEDIKVALIKHATKGARSLREQGLRTRVVGTHLRTSRFIANMYSNTSKIELEIPTSQDDEIIGAALKCLKEIYRPGIEYAKVGIFFEQLEDADSHQLTISDLDPKRGRGDRRMASIDKLNAKFGKRTIYPASILDTSAVDPHRQWLTDINSHKKEED